MLELNSFIPAKDVVVTPADRLTLPYALRQRSRQRVVLQSGQEAGLILAPPISLVGGDQLRSRDGVHVLVESAPERLSDVRVDDPVLLARASYHLGNRHVRVQIGRGWLRYEPDHVLDQMLTGLGLVVEAISAPFEPERGAYHVHSHSNAHARAQPLAPLEKSEESTARPPGADSDPSGIARTP
jgi:urease accessory protein